jgi:threonyl-tRNA synthetase
MLVVGEREEKDGTVSVRKHGQGDLGPQKMEDFAAFLRNAVEQELGELYS